MKLVGNFLPQLYFRVCRQELRLRVSTPNDIKHQYAKRLTEQRDVAILFLLLSKFIMTASTSSSIIVMLSNLCLL